jgi:two-component system chemotaxis sensor kinase CheA
MSKESDFLERLKKTFKAEAEEHRAALMTGLLELERGESGEEREAVIVAIVFREAHSLKGAARAVSFVGIERLCQAVEEIFSGMKKERRRPSRRMFDALYRALDLMAELTNDSLPEPEIELAEVLKLLSAEAEASRGSAAGKPREEAEPVEETLPKPVISRKAPIVMSETVRISAALLGSIFLRAEEMLAVKQSMARQAAELRDFQAQFGSWTKIWADARPFVKKLRKRLSGDAPLERLFQFLDDQVDVAVGLGQSLVFMGNTAALESVHAGERADSLLAEIRTALMLPVSILLESFPRMVRDIAAEEGKELSWEVVGEDTQIDRRVLEELKDPLIHIVRNSIDHGIEGPEAREKRGKPRAGIISLTVERADKDKVEIAIRDDGSGVDLLMVKEAAVARGFLSEAEALALGEHENLELIFLPELSTSQILTDISGRGLGLAIARERIKTVGGRLSVETIPGEGTVFRIQVPVTLATFRCVLVESRGRIFAIPTASVDQVVRVYPSNVLSVDRRDSIVIDGRPVSLASLGDILGLRMPSEGEDAARNRPAIVLLVSGSRVAFRVDEVLGEQEVLEKSLGTQLRRVRNVSGATVLPTGEVVPILNPSDLLRSAALGPAPLERRVAKRDERPREILVADDSVTSRMLVKNILETAGYKVTTAADGEEAFEALSSKSFDLLVSDIDMPRMDGFALCARLRALASTAELPILLLSSRDSREAREKGIDAGADAYISKSGLEKSSLLEVVGRLVA